MVHQHATHDPDMEDSTTATPLLGNSDANSGTADVDYDMESSIDHYIYLHCMVAVK